MKAKYILSGLLMVALVIGGTGYGVAADSGDKVTGGGTFNNIVRSWNNNNNPYADFGDKISFGFNGQAKNGIVKGQFQLVNHDSGMRLHGTFSSYEANGARVKLDGECSIGSFHVETSPGPGYQVIEIWIGDSPPSLPHIKGQIRKGNITKH